MRRLLQKEIIRHAIAVSLAIVVGIVASIIVAQFQRTDQTELTLFHLLLAYGVYGFFYLALSLWCFRGARGPALRSQLVVSDTKQTFVTRWVLGLHPVMWGATSAMLALLAVITLLAFGSGSLDRLTVTAAIVCMIGSWVLLFSTFAVEYARRWAVGGHLRFPEPHEATDEGDDARTMADFIYLSVQVSTTFASSDVELTTTKMRRLVTLHSLIAFAFSSVLVALFLSLVLTSA